MFYGKYGKRVLDFLAALLLLAAIWWFLLLVALLILAGDGRPVLFAQERIGQFGRPFKIYKFRTMVKNAEAIGPRSTASGDPRITPIGAFLRKTSLDELPQLFNVLAGDMSFVGFRPGVREDYEPEDFDSGMFAVRPGITGYAQVNGRSALTPEEKRAWERKYAADISWLTDMKILCKTVLVVLKRKGSN